MLEAEQRDRVQPQDGAPDDADDIDDFGQILDRPSDWSDDDVGAYATGHLGRRRRQAQLGGGILLRLLHQVQQPFLEPVELIAGRRGIPFPPYFPLLLHRLEGGTVDPAGDVLGDRVHQWLPALWPGIGLIRCRGERRRVLFWHRGGCTLDQQSRPLARGLVQVEANPDGIGAATGGGGRD
jgi:hypothetical protein